MKEFNTTGLCNPRKHYMVDIHQRLQNIKVMIDAGKYFCMNRARQYGKTTTLSALASYLRNEYIVVDLDFQDIGDGSFSNEGEFCKTFSRIVRKTADESGLSIPASARNSFLDLSERSPADGRMDELLSAFSEWCRCSEKPMVLMIDEVDTATNNQVFLDFLAQLRSLYLKREKGKNVNTFQSVILAGVTDVKHLKAKIRPEDDIRFNSPWNIAADFNIDMSLSEAGIKGMLDEYEADHHTGMDTAALAACIVKYTSGYPYLVSRICQLIDTKFVPNKFASLSEAWTENGVDEAVKYILADGKDSLFESIMGKLKNYPTLVPQLRDILMKGDVITWKPDDAEQKQLHMYGFIRQNNNTVAIANRVFEMRLYQYFLGETTKNDAFRRDALRNKPIFINDDHTLNMPLILDHFVKTQRIIHKGEEEHFLENEGRERFLTYIAPIVNGTGTFSIEEQTRDQLRMDVVIHYMGHRYIVELKIWHGQRYHEDGEKQIKEYLDRFGLTTGYMVSFNVSQNKEPGVQRVIIGEKVLFEAMV